MQHLTSGRTDSHARHGRSRYSPLAKCHFIALLCEVDSFTAHLRRAVARGCGAPSGSIGESGIRERGTGDTARPFGWPTNGVSLTVCRGSISYQEKIAGERNTGRLLQFLLQSARAIQNL